MATNPSQGVQCWKNYEFLIFSAPFFFNWNFNLMKPVFEIKYCIFLFYLFFFQVLFIKKCVYQFFEFALSFSQRWLWILLGKSSVAKISFFNVLFIFQFFRVILSLCNKSMIQSSTWNCFESLSTVTTNLS